MWEDILDEGNSIIGNNANNVYENIDFNHRNVVTSNLNNHNFVFK